MKIIKPKWPVAEHINAYTSTRLGGQSQTPYNSLNLATHVGDNLEDVGTNRKILLKETSLPNEPIWLNQIHGNTVIQADNARYSSPPTADAAWTNKANTICVVLTGDCLPILLCNTSGTQVAAIHAGWRGLANGVIENTLREMPVSESKWLAWLGPAISPAVYEISDDVRDQFLQYNVKASSAFTPSTNNKWLADLYTLAKQRLNDCGIDLIYGGNHCTFTESDLFYSSRRDKGVTGRMATLIWIGS